jgi:hypothetical protein
MYLTLGLPHTNISNINPKTTMTATTALPPPPFAFHLESFISSETSSLQIFIVDNNGADVTQLSGLKFFGTTVVGTNMAEFKKAG